MMDFVLKTRNCVLKTKNFVFKMMNFAGTSPGRSEMIGNAARFAYILRISIEMATFSTVFC